MQSQTCVSMAMHGCSRRMETSCCPPSHHRCASRAAKPERALHRTKVAATSRLKTVPSGMLKPRPPRVPPPMGAVAVMTRGDRFHGFPSLLPLKSLTLSLKLNRPVFLVTPSVRITLNCLGIGVCPDLPIGSWRWALCCPEGPHSPPGTERGPKEVRNDLRRCRTRLGVLPTEGNPPPMTTPTRLGTTPRLV